MQKQISTLIGIIIIVAVAVILFGGVFAYQYFMKSNAPAFTEVTAGKQNLEPETAGVPVQSSQATEGWKTFTNTKYGIEVKYPSDWAAKNAVVACTRDNGYTPPDCADGIGHGITLTSLAPYDSLTNPTGVAISFNSNLYLEPCADKITIGTKVFCRQAPDLVSYGNRILQETSDIATGKYTAGPYFNNALFIKYTEIGVGTNKQVIKAGLLIYDFGMEVKKNTENQYQQTKTIPPQFSDNSTLIKEYEPKIKQTEQIFQNMLSTFRFTK
ncbi:MAG: hypothetical protein AAB352_00070 [Patescibacteria group bacterium]